MMINVEFDGGPDSELESKLTKLLGDCDGSGCCMFGNMTRDMQFNYKYKSKKQLDAVIGKAKAIAKKLGINGFQIG